MSVTGRRLLFVVNDAPFFVSHRLPLAVAARAAGYEVHAAVPADTPATSRITAAGIAVHHLPLHRSATNPVSEARTVIALVRLYRRLRPDIVHHVTVKPVLYGSMAARLTRVPAVVNAVSGLGYIFLAQGPSAAARRAAVRAAYRVAFRHPRVRTIFQNPDDLEGFTRSGLLPAHSAVLIRGSGVDLREFTATPEQDGRVIVMLPARMLWDKGVGEFVAAARQLNAVGVDARFVLVGESDLNRAAVPTEQLRAWHDEGTVEWWGRRDDMPATLARAHVVCLPSYREGLPKVLLEAAACQRAIVTTDVPGCRDAIENGETGLLVPVRDADALATAIRRLVGDPVLRQRMGRAGRARAERDFSVARVVEATLATYRELLP